VRPEKVRGRGTFGRTDGWTDALPFFCGSPSLLPAYIPPSPVSDRLPHHAFTPLHSTPRHSTPLHARAFFLLAQGKDPAYINAQNAKGVTALNIASHRCVWCCVVLCGVVWCGSDRLLVCLCVCRLARRVDGSPPYPTLPILPVSLHQTGSGYLSPVRELLERCKADVNIPNTSGSTSLIQVCACVDGWMHACTVPPAASYASSCRFPHPGLPLRPRGRGAAAAAARGQRGPAQPQG